jgi:hypothetical protein
MEADFSLAAHMQSGRRYHLRPLHCLQGSNFYISPLIFLSLSHPVNWLTIMTASPPATSEGLSAAWTGYELEHRSKLVELLCYNTHTDTFPTPYGELFECEEMKEADAA